jgi:hypothetical protein
VFYLAAILMSPRWVWASQAMYIIGALLWFIPDRRIERALRGDVVHGKS